MDFAANVIKLFHVVLGEIHYQFFCLKIFHILPQNWQSLQVKGHS